MSDNGTARERAEDRRQYYRIEDDVLLEFRIVSEAELAAGMWGADDDVPDGFGLLRHFAGTSQRLRPVMKSIEEQSSEVAKYLNALDEKLDLLAKAVLGRNMDLGSSSTHRVNLSAGGLALVTGQRLDVGTLLQMRFVLLPAMLGVRALARVIHCQSVTADTGSRYRVATEFLNMSEDDQDLVTRHIFQKQTEDLRRRREARWNDESSGGA